jgi:hypothetical protein
MEAYLEITKTTFDTIFWGETSRRDISLYLSVKTTTTGEIKRFAKKHLVVGDRRLINYTNDAGRAKTNLVDSMEVTLESIPLAGDVLALVGDMGGVWKEWVVRAFTSPESTETCDVRVLNCSPCGNCGLNPTRCGAVSSEGPPASLVDYGQMLGRAGRRRLSPGVLVGYESLVVLSVPSVNFLFSRIASSESAVSRKDQYRDAFKVLSFLLLPGACIHVSLESHFEDPRKRAREDTQGDKVPCGSACWWCRGELGLPVDRSEVIRVLQTEVFLAGSVKSMRVVELLCKSENRSSIWGPGGGARNEDAHRLVLQLVAAGILSVSVKKTEVRCGIELET